MPTPASTTRQETAGQAETANDSFTAPNQADTSVVLTAEEDILRLQRFLEERFPNETYLTNVQHPQTAVDVAMRLLMGRQARADHLVPRCGQSFCNKAEDHQDVHGWVHYD